MIESDIAQAYEQVENNKVYPVIHKNILIIGRTRTGKSTIKQVLLDPRKPAKDIGLASATKEATFESFIIENDKGEIVMNIIDTLGLFETGSRDTLLRDNPTIINTIKQCIEREITKFHLICFCASFESGVNAEDAKAIEELVKFLGEDLSKISCLIITRCESKTDGQRNTLQEKVKNHKVFQHIYKYFGKGIFFSGSLSHDSWMNATDDLYTQFNNVVYYRNQIITLIRESKDPISVDQYQMKVFLESKKGSRKGSCLIM